MTREKKELIKQLRAINDAENLEMSIGPLSPEAFNALREEYEGLKKPLFKRLNVLMHGRLNDYYGACIVNEEGESRMDSVQEVCDLLSKCVKQVQED